MDGGASLVGSLNQYPSKMEEAHLEGRRPELENSLFLFHFTAPEVAGEVSEGQSARLVLRLQNKMEEEQEESK